MKLVRITLTAAALLFAAGQAQAMPVLTSPAITATSPASDAPIILARGGCGFGEHRGPYAGCRLNRGPRGMIRRLVTGAPRGCPPGRHRVAGICRRNF